MSFKCVSVRLIGRKFMGMWNMMKGYKLRFMQNLHALTKFQSNYRIVSALIFNIVPVCSSFLLMNFVLKQEYYIYNRNSMRLDVWKCLCVKIQFPFNEIRSHDSQTQWGRSKCLDSLSICYILKVHQIRLHRYCTACFQLKVLWGQQQANENWLCGVAWRHKNIPMILSEKQMSL